MNEHICFDKKIFLFSIFIVVTIIYVFFESYTKDKENSVNMYNLLYKSINDITKSPLVREAPNKSTIIKQPYLSKLNLFKQTPTIIKIIKPSDNKIKRSRRERSRRERSRRERRTKYYNNVKSPVSSVYEEVPPAISLSSCNYMNKEDIVRKRDTAVIKDVLYPPYSRTERPVFDQLINNPNINMSTRGSEDTFRQIGFLVNKDRSNSDMGNNNWRLFGRQSYRGSTIGEYYVLPVDVNYANLKIFLKDDMMPQEKIRDMYALPSNIHLKASFFSSSPYEVIELPKPDLNSSYL